MDVARFWGELFVHLAHFEDQLNLSETETIFSAGAVLPAADAQRRVATPDARFRLSIKMGSRFAVTVVVSGQK